MNRLLIALGVAIVIAGIAWPWLEKIGLFRLPGDIVIERENFRFYFPITSMVIISVILSVVLWLLRK